jgi:hypothetical protein
MAIKRTTDHEEIRKVIEEHSGKPAMIIGSANENGEGVLAISFNELLPNTSIIGWQEFFDVFEKNKFRFRYEEEQTETWEYGFESRDEPTDVDEDETVLPEEIEGVEENMFPSA